MPSPSADNAIVSKLVELCAQAGEIDRALADPEITSDHRKAAALGSKRAALAPVVEAYRAYEALVAEAEELRSAAASDDAELAAFANEELPDIEARAARTLSEVKAALVQSDDRKVGSVILEVRAGTGGDEAGLWARDLLEVYRKYASRRSWAFEPMTVSEGDEVGGIRHAVVNVRGEGVWLALAFEAGVHSVKRVPATETQGRIHTSTCTVAVLPEPEAVDVRIDWGNDVEEHVTTAQGPGGQNVNKVATAVHLVHKPTGVEVRMQETKSQAQNREKARRLLVARVHEIERARAEAERSAERRGQIGTGQRSEKIRVYRYQDGIVADQRLDEKFQLRAVLEGDLEPLLGALIEQETARRLAAL